MGENNNTKNVKINNQKQQQMAVKEEAPIPMGEEWQRPINPQADLAATELFNATNDLVKSMAKTAAEEFELRSELKQLLSRYLRDSDYVRYRDDIGEFIVRRFQ